MDEIHFYCTICGVSLSALSHSAGGFCDCPRCLRVIPIPGYPAQPGLERDRAAVFSPRILEIQIKFISDCCENKIRVDARLQGTTCDCPVCGKTTKVPEWGGTLPPAGEVRAAQPVARLSAEEYEFLSTPMGDSGRMILAAGAR